MYLNQIYKDTIIFFSIEKRIQIDIVLAAITRSCSGKVSLIVAKLQ